MTAAGFVSWTALDSESAGVRAPEDSAVHTSVHKKCAHGLQTQGVLVPRPAAENEGLVLPGRRPGSRDPRKPGLDGLGGQVFVGLVTSAPLPPTTNLAHRRKQDVIDGAFETQRLAGLVEALANAGRVEVMGCVEEGCDQRVGRSCLGSDRDRCGRLGVKYGRAHDTVAGAIPRWNGDRILVERRRTSFGARARDSGGPHALASLAALSRATFHRSRHGPARPWRQWRRAGVRHRA